MAAHRLVLDSGFLTALAAEEARSRVVLRRAIQTESEIVVPTVVVAESTTGTARDAGVNRILNALETAVAPLGESVARSAGTLRFRSRLSQKDTIDAIVVATADAVPRSTILTSDGGDIRILAAITGSSTVMEL